MLTAEKLVELKHERFVREMADLSIVTPKIKRLLKNNHVGIALKRFVNREIEYVEGINSIITPKSTHVLRVESKKNGKRFNAVINYEPISFFQMELLRRITGLIRLLLIGGFHGLYYSTIQKPIIG